MEVSTIGNRNSSWFLCTQCSLELNATSWSVFQRSRVWDLKHQSLILLPWLSFICTCICSTFFWLPTRNEKLSARVCRTTFRRHTPAISPKDALFVHKQSCYQLVGGFILGAIHRPRIEILVVERSFTPQTTILFHQQTISEAVDRTRGRQQLKYESCFWGGKQHSFEPP